MASDGYDSAEVLPISDQDTINEWILDSGCTFHMCPSKSWFETLQESRVRTGYFGQQQDMQSEGNWIYQAAYA